MKRALFPLLVVAIAATVLIYLVFFNSNAPTGIETVPRSYRFVIDPETMDQNYILQNPQAIKIGLDNQIYILDQGRSRILVYDKDMKFVRQIGREGQAPGEFIEPTDLDLDLEGNIYVAEFINARISVLDKLGNLTRSFRLNRMLPQDVQIAVSPDQLIYVNTIDDSLITVYDREGNEVLLFGSLFQHPKVRSSRHYWNTVSLDFDYQGRLWVLYRTKPLVRCYSKAGSLIFEKEIQGPDIEASKKKERPMPPERYIDYLSDIDCSITMNRVFASGHNYVYEISKNGEVVRIYSVQYPLHREETRYYFINRLAFNPERNLFLALSSDGYVFSF